MSQKTELPDTLRIIFESHGVIKRPTVPSMDKLIEEIKGRGMGLDFDVAKSGLCQAEITTKGGHSFIQVADSPELSVALAFGEALTATVPRQPGLFGDVAPDGGTTAANTTAEDVEFRDLALTAEIPLDTMYTRYAEQRGISPLELVDLLVEHEHAVIWLPDFGAIVDVTGQAIDEAQLRRWVDASDLMDPVLTVLELAIYREFDAGRPIPSQSRDIAITALERKAEQFELLRSEARQREIGNRDLGYESHADYWAAAAIRRAEQVARCQVRAAALRAEIEQENTIPDVSGTDPDSEDSPAPESHAQMIAGSLGITVDELADLLTEHGHDVIATPDREIHGLAAEQKIEDEQLSDWVGLAMNSQYEPGLSGVQSDLYRLVLDGKIPSNRFGRENAAKGFDEKARWYELLRSQAHQNEQLALDGVDGDFNALVDYWGRVAARWNAKAEQCHATAKQLRAQDAQPDQSTDQTAEQE